MIWLAETAPGADDVLTGFEEGTAMVLAVGTLLLGTLVVGWLLLLGVNYLFRGYQSAGSSIGPSSVEVIYFANGDGDYVWATDREWADGSEWFEVERDEYDAATGGASTGWTNEEKWAADEEARERDEYDYNDQYADENGDRY